MTTLKIVYAVDENGKRVPTAMLIVRPEEGVTVIYGIDLPEAPCESAWVN
jgi:hypothetical protein